MGASSVMAAVAGARKKVPRLEPLLRHAIRCLSVACLVVACSGAAGRARTVDAITSVPGIRDAYLAPGFWTARLRHPDAVLLDDAAIARQNERMVRLDPTMHVLRALPAQLPRAQVAGWIERLASPPATPLFDASGARIATATLEAIAANRALDAIAEPTPTRYALVVRRAGLRSFPTGLRVFTAPGDTDLDRFQESALFPGTPVVIAHESRDRRWLFVVSPRYAAWVERDAVAEGARQQVLDYVERAPARLVTGAGVRTAFAPDAAALSELRLDMGVRLPLVSDPPDVVNGQNAYSSWVVSLPARHADGTLRFEAALLPKHTDTSAGPLPLTQANVLRQSFKFLGERYGWGHDYGTRDCSGFVSEVYRSMGVLLPRNTGDQARSPALERTHATSAAQRQAALRALRVGDLVYIPGHVMLVIGWIDGEPYVIHDIHGGNVREPDGVLRPLRLNAVSVTPLAPLRFDDGARFVDRITDIVRIRNSP